VNPIYSDLKPNDYIPVSNSTASWGTYSSPGVTFAPEFYAYSMVYNNYTKLNLTFDQVNKMVSDDPSWYGL
jgi:hypothetical protein